MGGSKKGVSGSQYAKNSRYKTRFRFISFIANVFCEFAIVTRNLFGDDVPIHLRRSYSATARIQRPYQRLAQRTDETDDELPIPRPAARAPRGRPDDACCCGGCCRGEWRCTRRLAALQFSRDLQRGLQLMVAQRNTPKRNTSALA